MHSELYNDNIIALYCAWKDPQYIYVAVEWAPNGDIFSMLKRFGDSGIAESVVVTKVLCFVTASCRLVGLPDRCAFSFVRRHSVALVALQSFFAISIQVMTC